MKKLQLKTSSSLSNYLFSLQLSYKKKYQTRKKKQERFDKAYLRIALEWAKLSHCERKQVGAIIVKGRMIISDGFNGTPTGFENCCEDEEGKTQWYVLHAEANAILKVANSTNSCEGATPVSYTHLTLPTKA